MTVADSPGMAGAVGAAAEVTSFVGRKTEMADVSRLLAVGRLVTLLGPGGVGKTRAAFRAARQAADQYPDGVRIVELSELRDPELLPNTAAVGLGLIRQEMQPQLDAVLDYLCSRQLLLVLDTCEHLVEACALFAETVLQEAPDVTILATSRQPLDTVGEHTYRLLPLPVPAVEEMPDGAFTPAPLPRSLKGTGDAAELFAERAAAVDPEFEVTTASWPDMVRVCRRLDGIPLAIELAAVRLRALSLRELADQIDTRFDMLATRPGETSRHQTLGSTIEWSFDLCSEAERALWERLSVFAGTFDAVAAREVCADRGLRPGEILPALVELVEKSVLVRDGERYRMLDTIREFGAGRLAASGQDAIYRGRHVEYYLEAARSFAGHFLDHDQPERMRTLGAEHTNLRAAMRYGLSSNSERLVRDGAELATALFGYWNVSGLWREGEYWLGLALESLPAGPSLDRAWVLAVRSAVGPDAGMPERAVTDGDEAVAMARALGDEGMLLGRASWARMYALTSAGRLEEAPEDGTQARRALEAAGDRIGLMMLEATVAHRENLAGNTQAAFEACTRGLTMLREGSENGVIGEQWLQGLYYLCAGFARCFQGGGYEDAARLCIQALAIQAGRHDFHNSAYAIQGLGWVAALQKRWGRAAWLLGGADALWGHQGSRLGNNPLLEELHQQTIVHVRKHLGGQRFEELFAEGARRPLDEIARYAIADAEALPRLAGPDEGPKNPMDDLTRREREIAELMAGGLSDAEVADKLSIPRRTVDAHVGHICGKFGVTSREMLVTVLLDKDTPQ